MKNKAKFVSSAMLGIGLLLMNTQIAKADTVNQANNSGSMSTINNKVSENNVSPTYEQKNIVLNNQGQEITNETLDKLSSKSTTIYVDYKTNNNNALQALCGLSDKDAGYNNNYASIYVRNNGTLGAEVRDAKDNINYLFETPASVNGTSKGIDQSNKVAFVANASDKTYKLFSNGTLVFSQNVSNFKPINEIFGLNDIRLGGVDRSGNNAYGFDGTINDIKFYNEAISDTNLLAMTENQEENHLIFKAGDATESNYFRIPTLNKLNSGRLIASADARYGGTHDAKSKINIATSYSDDNGQTWSSPILALKFDDYAQQLIDWPRDPVGKNVQIQGSASFIDSATVQSTKNGNVYLFADFMPAGIGNGNSLKTDSGFKEINGKYYLKLRLNTSSAYDYSIRENGIIYDDLTEKPTEYKVDSDYNILKNNEPLYVEQYSVKFDGDNLLEYHNGNQVKMNIFYKDALFKVTPTNYVGYTVSKNNGESWSNPTVLPPFMGLNHNGTYLCPGQGLETSDGRLIFASYANKAMLYIISDDGGLTWHSVQATLPFANATAEAQMVELKPNVIRTYMRTTTGKIGYITSYDNGNTWDNVKYLDFIHNTSYGTQLSIIKYSQKIDGHEALIMSTPNSTTGRRNGQIWVGLVDDSTGEVDWKYHYNVDKSEFGYSYSALAETSDYKIALLYEKYDSWSRNELHLKNILKLEIFDLNDLLKNN